MMIISDTNLGYIRVYIYINMYIHLYIYIIIYIYVLDHNLVTTHLASGIHIRVLFKQTIPISVLRPCFFWFSFYGCQRLPTQLPQPWHISDHSPSLHRGSRGWYPQEDPIGVRPFFFVDLLSVFFPAPTGAQFQSLGDLLFVISENPFEHPSFLN